MSLKTYYKKESVPKLKSELKIKNELDLPKLLKVIVSVGLSNARFDKNETKERLETLKKITGQNPIPLRAKKAISNFKIRQGQIIAYMVTLRGEKMYDFIDKFINVALPRIRDFRGIHSYSIDNNGNISIGIKEHIAFPEIKIEEVEKMHGLGVTIVTTSKDKEESIKLLKSIGAVISDEKRKKDEDDRLESIEDLRQKRETKSKEIKTKLDNKEIKEGEEE